MPFCVWFQADQKFACMSPDLDFGGQQTGCEVGCFLCNVSDGALDIVGVYSVGTRWVRPSVRLESRDAHGRRQPLISNVPRLMPRGLTHYELAPCFTQRHLVPGEEHFNLSICDCPFTFDPVDGWFPCLGLPPATLVPGKMCACWAFLGYGWPPRSGLFNVLCTGIFLGAEPVDLRFLSGRIGQAALVRTDECTSNLGVLCWGHTENSDCDLDPGEEYYNDRRDVWNFCHSRIRARFVEHPDAPDNFQAGIAARNVVMEFLENDTDLGNAGLMHFDQLNSARRSEEDQNRNSQLETWSRSWPTQGDPDPIPWDDLPVVMEFPNSKLVNTQFPVLAKYVIIGASVEMSMVLHRISEFDGLFPDRDGSEVENPTYPIIRIRIDVQMGMRVRFADGDPQFLDRTWRAPDDPERTVLLTIDSGYNQPFARVLPANMDQITYIDPEGRTLAPPPLIRWDGHLGFFSNPQTTDRFHHGMWTTPGNPQVLRNHCRAMAAGFDGLQIPALESHPDRDEGQRKRIGTGHMTITFPWRDG